MSGGLSNYEGREVVEVVIVVKGTGDGLSAHMPFEPRELHHGERVQLLVDCEVTEVAYPPIKKGSGLLKRKQVLQATAATWAPEELALPILNAAAERLAEWERAQRDQVNTGQQALEVDAEAQALVAAHDAEEHRAQVVDGCPSCRAEVLAVEHEDSPDTHDPPVVGCPLCKPKKARGGRKKAAG